MPLTHRVILGLSFAVSCACSSSSDHGTGSTGTSTGGDFASGGGVGSSSEGSGGSSSLGSGGASGTPNGTGASANAGGTNSGGTGTGPGATGGATSDSGVALNPAYELPYYRVRVEFLDQGDWATLQIVDPTKVIKARQMSLTGTANVLGIDKTQLALNTNFGSDLSVVADLAIVPSAIDTPFQFSLQKGASGTVTIRVSSVIGMTVTLLKEITKQPGTLDFSVDLSSFKGVPPIEAPLAPVKNMGLALYYPWYSLDTWKNNPSLRDTPTTPYASNDPAALDRQIDQAESAGITGFVVSWIGPGSSSDDNVKLLLTEAAKKNFFIGFFLETTSGNLKDNPDTAVTWLSYIASQYSDNPAVLEIGGKPVVIPWVTNTIPSATWSQTRAAVRAKGKDVWLVQDCQDADYWDVFDGVWYDGGIKGLGEKVRYYSVLADHPAAKVWISTSMPGFDERLLNRPNPRYTDRANGAYFKSTLDAAFANSPQWVAIYTWNEWFEETYIEPSVNYGDQYLKQAGTYLNGWVQP